MKPLTEYQISYGFASEFLDYETFKGTVMQIEKVLINESSRIPKVS